MQSKRVYACILSLLLFWTSLPAAQPQLICGTQRGSAREEVFLHRQSAMMREKTRQKLGLRAAAGPAGRDYGNIAVMYDSGGVIARRNPFNLASKSITFTPGQGFTSYKVQSGESTFDSDAAGAGEFIRDLGDDDTRRFRLPFEFPYFGKTWPEIWVNSDGNVTFGVGDSASVSKSVGLLWGGPPRIAPLFDDLDATHSLQGVKVLAADSRFVVTWIEIPEYGRRGTLTFQLRLYPDGRIEFDYAAGLPTDAVVGISPGNAQGVVEIVSFVFEGNSEYTATVAERFTNADAIDSVLLAQRFYQTHDDAYDYLAVYNKQGIRPGATSLATEVSVRSTYRAGFGDFPVDFGKEYGSAGRLQAFLNMGALSDYPRDPNARVPLRGGTGDTPVTILAHETGHLFLALASVRDRSDPSARPMLGEAFAHWSFNFNSEASVLEGNRILDNGEGASPRFETIATVEGYSPLDQYLMGFRPPEEVPPLFLVRRTGFLNREAPQRGVAFNGDRQDISIEEIIAAEGRRAPDHTVSQRHFRTAIILLINNGAEPLPEDLAQLEQLRTGYEEFYQRSTDSRATVDTTLKKNLQLSLWPASGVIQDSKAYATVSIDRPAAADLTVSLKTQNGVATMPESVTIPAGETQVRFHVRGGSPGVEAITAEPSDPEYITDYARLQVSEGMSVQLMVVGGDQQIITPGEPLSREIEVRASDLNLLPYPGLKISASVTPGGVVEPSIAITGADGIARFRWMPGSASGNELHATLEESGASAVATATWTTIVGTDP